MAQGGLSLRVQGGVQLKQLSADLRQAGRGDLSRKMRRNIRVAARPVMADLRTAIMNVQVSSDKGGRVRPDTDTQLRSRIARAIEVRTTTRGIRLVVNAKRVGAYGTTLPKYMDATITVYRRWRHPVFGHDVWVAQTGQPWWFTTINRHATTFRRAVLDALDETIRELAR